MNTKFRPFTLNCRGKLLVAKEPIVMGILNVTPDSFYEGSRHCNIEDILQKADKMLYDGATILDIGAMSSRPGAQAISEEEEQDRLMPAIESIRHNFPNAIISIDTYRNKIAMHALSAGAHIINDITAGGEPEIFITCANNNAPYIAMHSRGTPSTMQSLTQYDDVVTDIVDFFIDKAKIFKAKNIKDIIIDPGFGFAKTLEQNYTLLHQLSQLHILGMPIMIGLSRKSMIYKILETTPEHALNGTTALHTFALLQGASILRVHDVKEAVEVVKLCSYLDQI